MPAADYIGGAAIFAAMMTAALGGAWLLLRRRFPSLRGAEAVVAFGVLATLAVLIIHLVPAALGLLGRGSVLVAAAAWLAACLAVRRAAIDTGPPEPQSVPEERPWALPLALVGAGVVGLFALGMARDQLTFVPASVDFASFHLPNVARWIQSGSIWQIDNFLPSVAPGNYPNNGDVMLLAFVLPWHNDFLAHFAIWPFYVLTGIAAYALALRLRAARSAALVAGSLPLAIPAVALPALPIVLVDSVMLFSFTAGLLFLLRHHQTGRTADLVLAGLALGISFGTKWYGVSAVAIAIAVWAGARLLAGQRWKRVLGQGAALAGLVGLAGGIWLVRNWVESGNPVFPVKVELLGLTLFDAPHDVVRERAGFTILDYFGDATAWTDYIWPQLEQSLAAPAALAVLGCIVAAVVLTLRRERRRAGVLWSAIVAVGLLIFVYSITPYTAGGPEGMPVLVGADARYVVPALILAAAVAARVATAVRWGTITFAVLGIAAIAHGISWAAGGKLATARLTTGDWLAAVVIVLTIAWVAWAFEPWVARARRRAPRLAAWGAAIVALLGAVAVGYAVQKRFNDDRYTGADPVIDRVIAAPSDGRRVGLAGVWTDLGLSPILPSFGPRFDSEVEYVGPVVREMQQRYESREAFTDALGRGDFDVLIVGRGRPELPPPKEGEWAAAAGWERIEQSDRLELYAPPSAAEPTES